MKVELTNLKHDQQNIGKRIKVSKKLYVWEFLAKFIKRDKAEVNLPYKVELKDSVQSGKKTVFINGVEIISNIKIDNFGALPYLIQQEPILLKIVKSKKQFQNYDLLVDDYAFAVIRQQGISYSYRKQGENEEWFSEAQPLSKQEVEDTQAAKTDELAKEDYQPLEQFVFKQEEQTNNYSQELFEKTEQNFPPAPDQKVNDFFDFDFQSDDASSRRTAHDSNNNSNFFSMEDLVVGISSQTPQNSTSQQPEKSFYDFNTTAQPQVQGLQRHSSTDVQRGTVFNYAPQQVNPNPQQYQTYIPQPFISYNPVYNPYQQQFATGFPQMPTMQPQMQFTPVNQEFHMQQMVRNMDTQGQRHQASDVYMAGLRQQQLQRKESNQKIQDTVGTFFKME